ncbi:MAG: S41 family peptidase [Bacteroidales bacterium]|nr:S41 family peptidase [Bacteroidales bacterium]
MKKIASIFALTLLLPFALHAQLLSPGKNSAEELENAMRKLAMATVMTQNYYVDDVDCNKLVEDAINGMLSKLDPHSAYSNPKDTKSLNEPLEGSFEGIGVQFNMLEDTLVVIQPVSKGPSEKVGILAGDRIINVNDTAIAGVKMSREEIMRRLRGPKNSKVKLGIKRDGVKDVVYFTVTRDKIPVNTLDAAYMVTPTIGLVRFSSFGATTHDEVVKAVTELKEKGMKSLIIDLQQNGGGYLNAAADLASEFLPKGDLIVYTKGRSVPPQEFRSAGHNLFDGKIVVLIDEYSASAAEILSGAIQDQDRGLVVGRRSFGKGLVQRPINLPDGSMIRLTIAHYYTPSGRCVQKPYEKGKNEDYAKDVLKRLNSGELTNVDSMKAHMPDSLKYQTLRQHRTVYGGGGIMPDHFIPLDTTIYTPLYRELSAKSYIINTNLRYMDKNRKKLTKQYDTFEKFNAEFQIPDEVTDKLLADAEKNKVKAKDDAERQATIPQLKRMLKALAARDLFDMNEYFQIIYADNEMVKKAVELLQP